MNLENKTVLITGATAASVERSSMRPLRRGVSLITAWFQNMSASMPVQTRGAFTSMIVCVA